MKCLEANLILFVSVSLCSCHIEPIVLVHGGADDVPDIRVEGRIEGVKAAATAGYKIIKKGGNVADAVEAAVKIMEDVVDFNAGYGSALNVYGEVEMDAAIMVGSNLSSGAVTGIKNVEHPISLARLIMSKSPHFLLAGEGAKRFAKEQDMILIANQKMIAPHAKAEFVESQKISMRDRWTKLNEGAGCGGVGAIAVDEYGHVAAAGSTGGRTAKLPGRVSDVATVGAGLYADDEVGAVVVTGHGEAIARYVMAHEIISAMKRGFEAGVATRNTVKGITEKFHKPTGAITVSKNGQVGISFTTEKMAWAYQMRDNVHYGVDDYDHFSEKIKI